MMRNAGCGCFCEPNEEIILGFVVSEFTVE